MPAAGELRDVPREARVAIVGGGDAGLAAALEMAKHGVAAVVLERGALGIGASTRNGGSVSGGVNIGKSFSGRAAEVAPERAQALLADAADAFSLIERLIEDEKIDCFWQKNGQLIHPVTCLETVQGLAGRVSVATSSVPLGVSHTTLEVHLEMPGEPGRARLTGDRERSPVFWAHHTVAAPA